MRWGKVCDICLSWYDLFCLICFIFRFNHFPENDTVSFSLRVNKTSLFRNTTFFFHSPVGGYLGSFHNSTFQIAFPFLNGTWCPSTRNTGGRAFGTHCAQQPWALAQCTLLWLSSGLSKAKVWGGFPTGLCCFAAVVEGKTHEHHVRQNKEYM